MFIILSFCSRYFLIYTIAQNLSNRKDMAFIHTDQSCFLSTHLFDQGYRIFLHFKSGTVTEVGRGENPALPVRIILENMNLEAPLLAGLLGKLTE